MFIFSASQLDDQEINSKTEDLISVYREAYNLSIG